MLDLVGKALISSLQTLRLSVSRQSQGVRNGWYTVERKPDEFHKAAKKVTLGLPGAESRSLRLSLLNGAKEKTLSIALIEAIRDAVGPDVEIMVEMHGRFTPRPRSTFRGDLEPFSPRGSGARSAGQSAKPWQKKKKDTRSPQRYICRLRPANAIHTRLKRAAFSNLDASTSCRPHPDRAVCFKARNRLDGRPVLRHLRAATTSWAAQHGGVSCNCRVH